MHIKYKEHNNQLVCYGYLQCKMFFTGAYLLRRSIALINILIPVTYSFCHFMSVSCGVPPVVALDIPSELKKSFVHTNKKYLFNLVSVLYDICTFLTDDLQRIAFQLTCCQDIHQSLVLCRIYLNEDQQY